MLTRKVKMFVSAGLAALGILAFVAFPSSAQAETITKYWDGYIEDTGAPVYGASVQIERQNTPPISYVDAYADSSSWVMVNNTNSSANQYAQTGFIELNTGGIYYFFEENDGTADRFVLTNGQSENLNSSTSNPNTMNTSNAVGPAAGYYHTYNVSYNASQNEWTGSVDGAFTNYFYAYSTTTWGNHNGVQYLDEVHQPNYAYFFGSISLPTLFYQPTYKNSSGTTYTPSNLQLITAPNAGYTSLQTYGGLSWDVWDTRVN